MNNIFNKSNPYLIAKQSYQNVEYYFTLSLLFKYNVTYFLTFILGYS